VRHHRSLQAPVLLSWFSYERFWTVSAAEVFVVLSGAVLGMAYGRKLKRGDWRGVIAGLSRRAALLYVTFLCVTLSLTLDHLDAAAWRDIALMRTAPWAFQIIGLYVWLVAAAIPCLLGLRYTGWIPLLSASWAFTCSPDLSAYPHQRPVRADISDSRVQLLFVHDIDVVYDSSCHARIEMSARTGRW